MRNWEFGMQNGSQGGKAGVPNSEFRIPNSELAIVGIGCLFPKAAGTGFFWANCKNGVDGITEVPPTHWDPADYFDPDPKKPDMTYARRGGFLSAVDFNPLEFGIAPKDLEATDSTQLLGLVAAKQALIDSGISLLPSPLGGEGAGVRGDIRNDSGGSQDRTTAPTFTKSPTGPPLTPHPSPPRGEGIKTGIPRSRVSVILGVTGTLELVIPLGARL